MAERNIKGTWKGQRRRVSKKSSPMIGMVYEGIDKSSGEGVIGILVKAFNKDREVILKTKENTLHVISENTLKIVA